MRLVNSSILDSMRHYTIINAAGMHMNVKPLPSAAKSAVPIQMQTCRANSTNFAKRIRLIDPY
jgi:hypothetical protein